MLLLEAVVCVNCIVIIVIIFILRILGVIFGYCMTLSTCCSHDALNVGDCVYCLVVANTWRVCLFDLFGNDSLVQYAVSCMDVGRILLIISFCIWLLRCTVRCWNICYVLSDGRFCQWHSRVWCGSYSAGFLICHQGPPAAQLNGVMGFSWRLEACLWIQEAVQMQTP